MNLEKFLVITGVPGVHKLISTRSNGLVVDDRKEGRVRFIPVRQQQVTPLATVSIFTETDEGSVPLADVFQKMLDLHETRPPVDADAGSDDLRAYFTEVLPDHDRDKVRIADIKKCIKWYNFMLEKGIFDEAKREAEADSPEAVIPEAESANPESPNAEPESESHV